MSTNTHKSTGGTHASSSKSQAAPASKSNTATGRSKTAAGGRAGDSKLEEFFHDEIKDIYWAEKKLVQTLPKMAKAATSEELKNAFTEHLYQTKEHIARLEQVFELLGHT